MNLKGFENNYRKSKKHSVKAAEYLIQTEQNKVTIEKINE